jgi:arylsulfatase A
MDGLAIRPTMKFFATLGFSQPRRVEPESGGPAGQLYQLDDDPGETKNLWQERPEIRDRLLAELRRVRTSGRSRPE